MAAYTIIIIIFGILILLTLIVLFFINRLLSYKNRVEHSFEAVSDSLRERNSLIDETIKFIQNKLEHEEQFIQKLDDIKIIINQYLEGKNKDDFNKFKKQEKIFLEIIKLEEIYDTLKSDKEYQKLKNNILLNQERMLYALDSYDKGVVDYNNYQENKFISILGKVLRFPKYDCYN